MNSNMQVAKMMFWVLVVGVFLFVVYQCNVLQDDVIAKRKHNKSDIGLGYTESEQIFKPGKELKHGSKEDQRGSGDSDAMGRIGGSERSVDPGREDAHQSDTVPSTSPAASDTQ